MIRVSHLSIKFAVSYTHLDVYKRQAQKLIKSHLVSGEMKVGSEVGLKIDQTLTQDATRSEERRVGKECTSCNSTCFLIPCVPLPVPLLVRTTFMRRVEWKYAI